MATANTGHVRHLIHFLEEHIKVHGKTPSARAYIKSNLELWKGEYGGSVSGEVEKHIRKIWADS